jgi:ribulose-5-phosphate 4-epimerase/fuculose-1-phosphate aldolase
VTAPPHESGIREALCRVGRALHEAGLLAGTTGNLSVRLDDRHVLVTPRAVRKDRITPEELVTVDLVQPSPEALGRATTEWPAHRACYQTDPSLRAVIHTHAPALTAIGIRGLDLAADLPELSAAVGRITIVPFAPSGSEEMGTVVGNAVAEGGRLLLLVRHGVISVGDSLDQAYDRTEMGELAAKAVLWGRLRS